MSWSFTQILTDQTINAKPHGIQRHNQKLNRLKSGECIDSLFSILHKKESHVLPKKSKSVGISSSQKFKYFK